MDQVEACLTDLDQWLSTAPDQLITEHKDYGFHPNRFQRVEAPKPPTLATIQDEQIAYDLEEAHRLLDGERPRVSSARPGDDQDTFSFFTPGQTHTPPEHLAAAQKALAKGIQIRAETVSQHRRATAAAAQERFQTWQDAQQDTNNQALREWATTYGKPEILTLLDNGAPAEQITDTLRSTLFEPFSSFAIFRKIRKQDLLIANPKGSSGNKCSD